MNPSSLQRWIDELVETTLQHWLLRGVAVIAPLGALLAAAAANERWWPFGLFIVSMLALASALRPDTHVALLAVVVIIWHWLAAVDGVSTAWLPVAGVCLLVFHTATALSATIPIGGALPAEILRRWLQRTALGSGATVGTWVLVVLSDRRDAAGNGLLTGLALTIIAIAAVALRSTSVGDST